jgi:hypothetical protein
MAFARKVVLWPCLIVLLMAVAGMKARTTEGGRREMEAFNKQCVKLHMKMDTAGIIGTMGGRRS